MKEKPFKIQGKVRIQGRVRVWAKDVEDARRKVFDGSWEKYSLRVLPEEAQFESLALIEEDS